MCHYLEIQMVILTFLTSLMDSGYLNLLVGVHLLHAEDQVVLAILVPVVDQALAEGVLQFVRR